MTASPQRLVYVLAKDSFAAAALLVRDHPLPDQRTSEVYGLRSNIGQVAQ